MQAALPVSTTCNRPDIDAQLTTMIGELVAGGLTIRQATESAARTAAADAERLRWAPALVDFVVIRTVDLGAQLAARGAARRAA